MSSTSPPPSPPPPPPPPPGPPPSGSPPPPPPSSSSVTSANYFFGFVITFVVLLLLFIGCGLGSWRRFRLMGTAWDMRLQDIEGNPFQTRKRARRRLIRPTFLERWTSPALAAAAHIVPSESKWESVQPISVALMWSVGRRKSDADAGAVASTASRTAERRNEEGSGTVGRGVGAKLRSYIFPRRVRCEGPSRPPPAQRPPPEVIQVAVMIAMPAQPSATLTTSKTSEGARYVGHSEVGEYQIGVARIPWPSGDGT